MKNEIEIEAKKYPNIIKKRDNWGVYYRVQFPNGKIMTYKRLGFAVKIARRVQENVEIPGVVTANTYFWGPSSTAGCRRSREQWRQGEIDCFAKILNRIPTIHVDGSYEESCKHVYKSMTYEVNGKKTNLTGLIGEAKRWGINLIKWEQQSTGENK